MGMDGYFKIPWFKKRYDAPCQAVFINAMARQVEIDSMLKFITRGGWFKATPTLANYLEGETLDGVPREPRIDRKKVNSGAFVTGGCYSSGKDFLESNDPLTHAVVKGYEDNWNAAMDKAS